MPLAALLLASLGLLAAPPQDEPAGQAEIERLTRNVQAYEARARLIEIGPRALPQMLEEARGAALGVAMEHLSTIRWIVTRWRHHPAAQSEMGVALSGFVRAAPADQRRAFAVDLLGDVGGGAAVDALGTLSSDPELGPIALLALARIDGPEAAAALVEASGALPPGDLRDRALEALALRPEPSVVPRLVSAAEAGSSTAFRALGRQGSEPALEWLFESARAGVDGAFEALAASEPLSRDGRLVARLLPLAATRSRRATLLATIRHPGQHHPELEAGLASAYSAGASVDLRRALLALGPRLDRELAARVALDTLAGRQDELLTPQALRLCARRCEASAADRLAGPLRSRNRVIRTAAIEALSSLPGEEASSELRGALVRSVDADVRRRLIEALGERTDSVAQRAILDLLAGPRDDEAAIVLAAALRLAGRVEPAEARRLWADSLRVEPTAEALAGLGRHGNESDVPLLARVLATAEPERAELALRSLVDLGRRLAPRGERQAAVAALHTAFEAGAAVDGDLRRLGERPRLVAHGGVVDAWWRTSTESGCEEPPAVVATLGEPPVPLDSWRSTQTGSARAELEVEGDPDGAGADVWLVADIEPRAAGRADLLIRASRPVRVWLDDEGPLEGRREPNGETRYAIRLSGGSHRLVLALCDLTEPVVLTARLRDVERRPLKFGLR